MLTRKDIEALLNKGGNVVGSDGGKIGGIGQLYSDDDTGEPTWVTVKTGLFGTSQSFVPVEGARIDGADLVVPYTRDQVKDAPRVDTDGGLEPEEEDRLYTHYGSGVRTYSEARMDAEPGDSELGESRLNPGAGRVGTGAGPGRRAAGRLRKYATTENVTTPGPADADEARQEHTGTDSTNDTRR
jgi:hypothetical protein